MPIVSTTIDFLDYVFYDREGAKDYYELSVWEKRLKELASCGIKKVYLRVNVCGATLWPSNVSPQYGKNGRVHWMHGLRMALSTASRCLGTASMRSRRSSLAGKSMASH